MDKYLTVGEMQQIIKICQAMDALYDASGHYMNDGINLSEDFWTTDAFDGDGKQVGVIAMTDDGKFGLYLIEKEVEK